MTNIGCAFRVAKKYYNMKTYDHAIRVAGFVSENPMIPSDKMNTCIALAIMHDLCEDTEFRYIGSDDRFKRCLDLLTKKKEVDYITYISNIRKFSDSYPEAYWVKVADMKDHLSQTETLTDKLKEKYLSALPYLL